MIRNKSISIVHCIFSLGCGGAERNLYTSVREIYNIGYYNQHVVISNFKCSDDLYYYKDISLYATIHPTQEESGHLRGNTLRVLKLFPQCIQRNIIKIQNCLHTIQPDVVHIWSDNAYAAIAASLLPIRRILVSWQSMPPVYWHKSGIRTWRQWPKTLLDTLLFRMALRNPAVRTACVSRLGALAYAHWFDLSADSVTTIHHGMDPSLWQHASNDEIHAEKKRLGLPSQSKVVLGLMRFDSVKRPELWFDVAERTRKMYKDELYFVCFGDGPLRPSLMARARQAGIICPGVTKNVSLALSIADILLHTARIEGLPTVHLEAQLMGVPIVTTDAGGTKETICEGVTAQVVSEQPDMVTALSETVLSVLEDNDFRVRAAEEGPRFIRQNFSIEKMVQTTLDLYR